MNKNMSPKKKPSKSPTRNMKKRQGVATNLSLLVEEYRIQSQEPHGHTFISTPTLSQRLCYLFEFLIKVMGASTASDSFMIVSL